MFDNLPVDVEQLPDLFEVELIPLERKYLTLRLISTIIISLILLIAPLILLGANDFAVESWVYAVIFGPLLLLIAFFFFIAVRGFKRMGYAIRQKDILFRKGVIFLQTIAVPFNRVQHAEIKEGPIERLLGLSTLHIYTAGGTGSDLSIRGLLPDRAKKIKDFILKKTAIDEEE